MVQGHEFRIDKIYNTYFETRYYNNEQIFNVYFVCTRFDVDWQKIQASTPGLAKSTRLTNIRNERDLAENTQDIQQLASRILVEKNPQKQSDLVQQYVIDLLCSWTGNTPSELDLNSSLYNYGMDSFSGLTFKMQFESSLHLSFEVCFDTVGFKSMEIICDSRDIMQHKSNTS